MAKKPLKRELRPRNAQFKVVTKNNALSQSRHVHQATEYVCIKDIDCNYWVGNKALGIFIHQNDVTTATEITHDQRI